jgi:hypothetical protein
MRIVFGYDNQTVSPSWNLPFLPNAGHFIDWNFGGMPSAAGIPPGVYVVESVCWKLDGSNTVVVALRRP